MDRTRVWRAKVFGAAGVLAVAFTFTATSAPPAHAHGAPGSGYQGDVKGVEVETAREFDGTNTTFTFTLKLNQGENQVSHVLLMSCPGVTIVGAAGPDAPGGAPKPTSTAPANDGSIKDSSHNGIKFDPGYRGVYTITFAGNIEAAQFVVKDGNGHQHFTAGDEEKLCQTVAQQTPDTPAENPPGETPPAETPPGETPPAETPPAETPPGETPPAETPPTGNPPANNPPTNTPPANNPPANNPPANNPPANQTSEPAAQVAGTAADTPGSTVLSEQLTAPEAQATLPRTGLPIPGLAPTGAMLLALGGLAGALGRWPRR